MKLSVRHVYGISLLSGLVGLSACSGEGLDSTDVVTDPSEPTPQPPTIEQPTPVMDVPEVLDPSDDMPGELMPNDPTPEDMPDDPTLPDPIVDAALYTQTGTDPTWQYILSNNLIPIGEQSTAGILGSEIDVNNDLVEVGPYADNGIIDDLRIHTVGNSVIPRRDFDKWTRWYQEDGNTQVFRLFKGEVNVRNDRPLAARVESFSPTYKWQPDDRRWHEWMGHYTILKAGGCSSPHRCAIFQAKGNNIDHWSVMLNLDDQGNIWFNRRRGEDFIIAHDMVGKSFDVRVRDNGLDYEVYLNGELQGSGQWQRTQEVSFRWGIYMGESEVNDDIMIFVTGAAMK